MNQIIFPKFKNYKDQRVNFIQPKLDGHLTKIYIDNHTLTAFTKNDKDITDKLLAIDHIKAELDNLPNNSVVFGERHCPGVDATSVPTMMNEADEKLQLTIFAAPLLNDLDYSKTDLSDMMIMLQNMGLDVNRAEPISRGFVPDEVKKILLQKAIDQKFEGWVLKEGHMTNWYKLKPVKTLDAVVTETFVSTSESYWGLLKAVRIIVYKPDGSEFNLGNVGIALKDIKEKYNTDEKRDTLIGRVCVVEYDKIGAKGGLRFPRMAKDNNDNYIWRTDKDPEQCTTEQLED